MELAQRTQRIIRLRGGTIVSDKALLHSSGTGEPETRRNGVLETEHSLSSVADSPIPRFSDSAQPRHKTENS
jgi:hypothetical protein